MKILSAKCVVAAAVLGLSAAASADTITGQFNYTHLKSINITSPTRSGDVNTVKFNWTRQDSPGPGVDSQIASAFNTYCVDLAQVVSANNEYAYNVVTPAAHGFSLTQTTMLERLWADYFPTIDNSDKSAAFQMAIWEIIHDTSLSLSAGTFKVNNAATAVALATGWLGNVSSAGYTTINPIPRLVVLESSSAQDQITVVPAPATGVLAGMGLLALGSRRRRA